MSEALRQTLASHARDFHRRGWMLGTSGNLSAREISEDFWITASGRSKGELTEHDFLRVTLEGEVQEKFAESDKPSAETSIHQVLYKLFPDTRAIYHVHSVENNLVSRLNEGGVIRLPSIEMIKGFNVWEDHPTVSLPVLPNYLDVPRIAAEVHRQFAETPPRIPAFLLENHGVTVWGNYPENARNLIELCEFIFAVLVRGRESNLG